MKVTYFLSFSTILGHFWLVLGRFFQGILWLLQAAFYDKGGKGSQKQPGVAKMVKMAKAVRKS